MVIQTVDLEGKWNHLVCRYDYSAGRETSIFNGRRNNDQNLLMVPILILLLDLKIFC